MEFTILVAVVLGVTEAVKRAFPKVNRFIPLIAIAFGMAFNYLYTMSLNSLLPGVVAGLSASGIWSGGKSLLNK